jgi:hypothetical protein
MMDKINQTLDVISNYLAQRKGLLPIIGILLTLLNGILQFFPLSGWIIETNLFLHAGVVIALIGFMLAWAL